MKQLYLLSILEMLHQLKILFIIVFALHAINLGELPVKYTFTFPDFTITEIEEDTHVFYDHVKDEKINTLFKLSGGSKFQIYYEIVACNFHSSIITPITKCVDTQINFFINQYRKNLLCNIYLPKLYILYHCAKDFLG